MARDFTSDELNSGDFSVPISEKKSSMTPAGTAAINTLKSVFGGGGGSTPSLQEVVDNDNELSGGSILAKTSGNLGVKLNSNSVQIGNFGFSTFNLISLNDTDDQGVFTVNLPDSGYFRVGKGGASSGQGFEFSSSGAGNNGVFFDTGASNDVRTVTIPTSSGTMTLNTQAEDIEITDSAKGFILTSPNSTRYRITVANDGTLSATEVV